MGRKIKITDYSELKSLSYDELLDFHGRWIESWNGKWNRSRDIVDKRLKVVLGIAVAELFPEKSLIIYSDNSENRFPGYVSYHSKLSDAFNDYIALDDSNIGEGDTPPADSINVNFIAGPFDAKQKSFNVTFYNPGSITDSLEQATPSDLESILVYMQMHNVPNPTSTDLHDAMLSRNWEYLGQNIANFSDWYGKKDNEKHFVHPKLSDTHYIFGFAYRDPNMPQALPLIKRAAPWGERELRAFIMDPIIGLKDFNTYIGSLMSDPAFVKDLDLPFDGKIDWKAYAVPETAHHIVEANNPIQVSLQYSKVKN